MKVEDFDETLKLIKQEINDAKLRAFDKLLYFLLSDYPTDMVVDRLEDKVLDVYREYKDDIGRLLRIYVNNPKLNAEDARSMHNFIKNLQDSIKD